MSLIACLLLCVACCLVCVVCDVRFVVCCFPPGGCWPVVCCPLRAVCRLMRLARFFGRVEY